MTIRTLSAVMLELKTALKGDRITVADLLEILHERGFGMALLLFSLPLCIPFPKPPGLSTLFGLPLFFLATQQMLGRHTLWMPGFILKRSLSRQKMEKIIDLCLPVIKKVETLVRPRLERITLGHFSLLIGFLGAVMAAFISLPLPGSNMVPALGIALMSTGIMVRDGLTVIIGAVVGIGWIIGLSSLYIIFGMEGFHALQAAFF